MKRKLLFFAICSVMMVTGLYAQDRQITGKVVNAADKTPVVGVTVVIRETMRGTVTDKNGEFKLSISPTAQHLDFSMIGMETFNAVITASRNDYQIEMSEVFHDLDALVVVGYGVQAKRDISGAITSISAKDIEQNPAANLNTALQGKIPGMQITTMSGEPGAGANISIRGASSISGGTEPLYIIDGVPVESENIRSIDGDASFSPIAGINPNDIESIEVLKDAASAAIYGSRAANGVIIITTKGGHEIAEKAPQITFTHTSSIVGNSRKLDAMSATQFREAYSEARIANGSKVSAEWATNPYSPYYNNSTDWQDIMFREVYQTRNDLTVRGSTKSTAYGISLGYRDLKPTIVYTGYNQYNFRGNFTYKVSKWLTGSTNLVYNNQDYNRVLSGTGNESVLSTVVKINPCYTPFDPLTGEIVDWVGDADMRNPLAMAKKTPVEYKRNWTTITQSLGLNILEGLSLKTSGTLDIDKREQSSYSPRIFSSATIPIDVAKYKNTQSYRYLLESVLTYNKTFNKSHKLSVIAGNAIHVNTRQEINQNGQDFLDGSISYIQNAILVTKQDRVISENALLSFFGRVNYSYNSRYILAVVLRADGSSRFGPNKRWGYFPSVSAAWRLSDEKFMGWAKSFLHDAKLRASYGVTGNQSIGDYDWRGVYAVSSVKYDGSIAMTYDGVPNHGLGWEATTQTNVGLDLSLFKGRVALTVDAYDKTSRDLLFNVPISSINGFKEVPINFGNIGNRGIEFLLETVNTTGAFKWNTTFNISFNRSRIISLPEGTDFLAGDFTLASEGKPLGIFYTHKALGIYSRDEDNVYTDASGNVGQYKMGTSVGSVFKGGDVHWYDKDGNGIIDDADRVICGDPNPKFIGGMGNSFFYKGFSLNVFFQWSYGNDVMNECRRERNALTLTRNLGQDMLRRWKNQGDVTDRPHLVYSDPMKNFRNSSLWIEDGSFLRLKDISLAYTFNFKKVVKQIKCSAAASNLLTWSKYSGYDPEVNTSSNPYILGVDNGAYPKSRMYSFTMEMTF